MKKLLAAGAEKIYYLGKVFRDGELTPLHNPEFTLAEWYRTHSDYRHIQEDTENLIRHVATALRPDDRRIDADGSPDLSGPWPRITLRRLFLERAGKDLAELMDFESIGNTARALSVSVNGGDDWESLFFKIYLERIEPGLGLHRPVFIEDYPACLGLMAREKAGDPGWVERTELYIGGLELANGYSELTDPAEQRARFLSDQHRKQRNGKDCPVDGELIEALESGLPPCAGMALGVDRLIMILRHETHIEDILPFPMNQMKPGDGEPGADNPQPIGSGNRKFTHESS